jgi:hypothetical protein
MCLFESGSFTGSSLQLFQAWKTSSLSYASNCQFATFRFAQLTSKNFLGAADHLDYCSLTSDHSSSDSYMIVHWISSYQALAGNHAQQILINYSAHFACQALPLFLWTQHLSGYPAEFSVYYSVDDRKYFVQVCHSVTKGRGHVCRIRFLHFNSPDLYLEHL